MKGLREWAAFLFLGCLAWGMSFLWIKVALEEIGPFMLVTYRLGFGVLATWGLLLGKRVPIRLSAREWGVLAFFGVLNTALPITLISWAEIHISSALAGILNSTTPLWTMIIAHWFLADDRFTPMKFLGLVAGFAGVVLLIFRDYTPEALSGSFWGQGAVILAAICYASANVFVKRFLSGKPPLQTAAVSLLFALLYMLGITPVMEGGYTLAHKLSTWLACGWLGIVGLGFAYQAYFFLIHRWGATRTATVTYVFPVTAVILGVVFLGESLHWQLMVGGALIIGGIAIVNAGRRSAKPM